MSYTRGPGGKSRYGGDKYVWYTGYTKYTKAGRPYPEIKLLTKKQYADNLANKYKKNNRVADIVMADQVKRSQQLSNQRYSNRNRLDKKTYLSVYNNSKINKPSTPSVRTRRRMAAQRKQAEFRSRQALSNRKVYNVY